MARLNATPRQPNITRRSIPSRTPATHCGTPILQPGSSVKSGTRQVALTTRADERDRAAGRIETCQIGVVDICNPDGYAKACASPLQASIAAHGGVQLAGRPGTVIEGSPPGSRFVIVRWDTMEQLKGWDYSPEYTMTLKIGEKYARFTVMAVGGVVR